MDWKMIKDIIGGIIIFVGMVIFTIFAFCQ